MSLQVWLPLIKDTNSLGLSAVSGSLSHASISYADGKLGKSIRIANYQTTTATYAGITNVERWSICVWLKINSADTFTNYNDFFTIGMNNNGATGGGFRIEHTAVAGAMQIPVPKTVGLTDQNSWYTFYSHGSCCKDQWAHIAVVCDGTNYYTYINGALASTVPISRFTTTTSKLTGTITLGMSGSYCYINDLRIYDHSLSLKEVREISKGLCVHFPLNKPNPNYFYNSNLHLNNTSNWYGVNGSSISVATKDGRKCITGTKGTTNNIVGQNALSYTYTANTTITVTISADVYVEVAGTITVGNWAATSSNGWQGLSGTEIWRTSNALKLGWNHICVTHKNYKNSTYSGALVTAFAYTGATCYLTNAKLEFSEYPTTWCPSTSDSIYNSLGYNSTTEYDISGYNNNGTISGTLTPSGDAPRYNSSLTFSSNSYISYQAPTNLYYATYSFWFKKPSSMTNAYGAMHAPITNPNNGDAPWFATNTEGYDLWCYFGDNLPRYTYGVSGSVSADTWYHVAYTWNNGVGQFYLNGEKHGSPVTYTTKKYISNSAKSTLGDSYTGSSWAGAAFTGQLSDFRLYTTVLSDADIKELYQTSVSITNNGTMFAYEYIEN